MSTADYTVMLFKEDRIMYLAKPAPALQRLNPLAAIDSVLMNDKSIEASIVNEKKERRIVLQFPNGPVYRKIEYFIDNKTGLLTRMVNTVQSDQLYDPTVKPMMEGEKTYAVIEAVFSHYQEGIADDKIFDTGRYFKKQDGDFVTVAPYTDYKIFFGTPGIGKAGE